METLYICGTIILIAIFVVYFAAKTEKVPTLAARPTEETETELIETAEEKRAAALAAREQWFKDNDYEISKIFIHNDGTEIKTVAVVADEKILLINETPIAFKYFIDAAIITSEYQTSTISSTKNNGIGRAVVGGALAGGAGAVIGATTAATTG
ncbi:MAG: hypothetical protein RSD48_04965, partial [Oscillospiraceae bacterium]